MITAYVMVILLLRTLAGVLVNEQTYEQIGCQMDKKTVLKRLGFPGDFRTRPVVYDDVFRINPNPSLSWKTDEIFIEIFFGEDGRVVGKNMGWARKSREGSPDAQK